MFVIAVEILAVEFVAVRVEKKYEEVQHAVFRGAAEGGFGDHFDIGLRGEVQPGRHVDAFCVITAGNQVAFAGGGAQGENQGYDDVLYPFHIVS